MVEKDKRLVMILGGIIAILLLVVLYAFVISPRIDGYAIQRQQEGFEFAIVNIAQLTAQCQPVPINLGQNEAGQNQTIHLVAIECFPERFPELNQQDQQNSETQ